MKKLALILLLIPFFASAQNQLTFPGGKELPNISSVIGIPFGKTKAEVITLMKGKGYSPTPNKESYLSFKNVKYGRYTAASFTLYFYKNKFYHGLIILIPEQKPKVYDEYNELVSTLSEKYGEPVSIREFKTPYKDGDGYEETAVTGGYATINDNWLNKGLGFLITELTKSTLIAIDYYHTEMYNTAFKEAKEDRQKDY